MALRGAAVELLVAVEAGVVDVHLVVELRGTVGDFNIAGLALAGALDLGAHVVVGHFRNFLLKAQVLVLAELDVGADEYFNREGDRLAALDVGLGQLRTIHDRQVVFLDRFLIDLGEQNIKRFLIEYARAVEALDDLHRGLALAEAGNRKALRVLVVRADERLLELVRGDLKAELYLIGREFLKSSSHCSFILLNVSCIRIQRYTIAV